MTNFKLSTQTLAVVAKFITIEEAWIFLTDFEINLSFATICSQNLDIFELVSYPIDFFHF
ncbi:hypothetical protein [Chamaesiphon minutus]|nr:hypothetical protein [Chamaesiphon minutus]